MLTFCQTVKNSLDAKKKHYSITANTGNITQSGPKKKNQTETQWCGVRLYLLYPVFFAVCMKIKKVILMSSKEKKKQQLLLREHFMTAADK